MADACTKCCHYSSAGRKQTGDAPSTDYFLGEVAHQVQRDYAAGTVTSAAQQQWAQHCATAAAAGGDGLGNSCSSNLSCSRASASARGVVDQAGTAGVSCAHGFPGRGLFVAMPTPEQHTYYFRTLVELLIRRPDLQDIYLDIGCRVKPGLMAIVQQLVAAGKLPENLLSQASVVQ